MAIAVATAGCAATPARAPAGGPGSEAHPRASVAAASPTLPEGPRRTIFDDVPNESSFFTLEVSVVDEPPPAVFLLASLDEGAPPDCDATLLAHARRLGANRLYRNREAEGCRGAAYMVPPGSSPPENYGWTVHAWMRQRWQRPDGITDGELSRLCVVTTVWTTSTLRLWKVAGAPLRPSGNAAFDESVRALLERVIDDKEPLPEPATVERSRTMRNARVTLSFTLGNPGLCR